MIPLDSFREACDNLIYSENELLILRGNIKPEMDELNRLLDKTIRLGDLSNTIALLDSSILA